MFFPFFASDLNKDQPRVWTNAEVCTLLRQDRELDIIKRDGWEEADLATLANEEHDNFERKSGRLFDSGRDAFLNTLAKAISAFANSGGGTIVVGQADDGSLDGITPMVGRDTIRDWIEKQIPVITDYPLADFRIHTVKRAVPSQIPLGREIIIIDVGDSASAPHQSKRDKLYYRREGGRSVAAPHFYLELLRQRLTHPVLQLELKNVTFHNGYELLDGNFYLICAINFEITNVGRVSANRWQINFRRYRYENDSLPHVPELRLSNFPTPKIQKSFISSVNMGDRAILPGCMYVETHQAGFLLKPMARTKEACISELDQCLSSLVIGYQIATEASPGSVAEVATASSYNASELVNAAFERYPEFFTSNDT